MSKYRVLAAAAFALASLSCAPKAQFIEASGTIEATEVRLASTSSGRILSMGAVEGASLAKGDAKGAVAPLLLSLAINPYDPSVHCSLAEAYKRWPEAPTDKRLRAERDCRELSSK